MTNMMIGVDLARNVFQLHGATMTGTFRKKLSRPQFLGLMSQQASAVVVMEACGSANFWAREMRRLGHEVRLIPPHYVRPFVKRQKNDASDAEAIVIAAQRPEMRFVEPKTEHQQACTALFRARERLLHQRTEADIRRLLIMGAMSRLNWLGRKSISEGSWLARMLMRKPQMLVAIALANKMARQLWSMLIRSEDYRTRRRS